MKVLLVTKNDCPKCNQLKMLLKFALNDKYINDIQVINKEDNQEDFDRIIAKHQLLSVPALIYGDQVLSKTEPSSVVAFLEKHLNK